MKYHIPLIAACALVLAGTAQAHGFPVTIIKTTTVVRVGVPAACRNAPVQTITVLNDANVPAAELAEVERVVTVQSMQLRRFWRTPCAVFGPNGWPLKIAPHTDCVQVSQRCISLHNPGYHNGRPESPTWTNRFYPTWGEISTRDTGGAPAASVAFSHEVLEMLTDPSGLKQLDGYNLEVCDPVEAVWYRLRGVWVSDFVTPDWFRYNATFPAGTLLDEAGRVQQPGDDSLS